MSIIPDGVMYAQVDRGWSLQDYAPSRDCLRLLGIDAHSFRTAAFNSETGCSVFLIDIAWDELLRLGFRSIRLPQLHASLASWASQLDDWPGDLWIRVRYSRTDEVTGAYTYELFADSEPTYLDLHSVSILNGTAVAPIAASPRRPTVTTWQSFSLSAFHVGQGMCALLKGSSEGFLFDAGAGIPILRATYKAPPATFTNQLPPAVQGLSLTAILSHPDSDHWRLLDWDPKLLSQVTAIFMPAGSVSLATKSTRIINMVYGLTGSTTVRDTYGNLLFKAHRSVPTVSDRNGECLVAEAHVASHPVVFPGDYVYNRMQTDGNSDIATLATSTLAAVIVPHHGDGASANVTVTPAVHGSSVAFFSAGTHAGYGHPTAASLKSHLAQNFFNVDRHTCSDILEYALP